MRKIRWGILSTARIATQKVIPAMQRSRLGSVVAIASRCPARARAVAGQLGIPAAFGSYQALLDSPAVDAIYIPLPNHLHVPWSIRSLRAGKHVLCEKPIGLSAGEAKRLVAEAKRHPELKVVEAFMYRHHPQWVMARDLVRQGDIGTLRAVQTCFTYFNKDPDNIRNQADKGGGALMDIGCYGVSLSRFLFEQEPVRVLASMQIDPSFGTDILTSAILDFGRGTASLTCATQLRRHQAVTILGEEGHIGIRIPFNAPPDEPVEIIVKTARGVKSRRFGPVDQYTLQANAFARVVIQGTAKPMPLDDAVRNMRVIDALAASARQGAWVSISAPL